MCRNEVKNNYICWTFDEKIIYRDTFLTCKLLVFLVKERLNVRRWNLTTVDYKLIQYIDLIKLWKTGWVVKKKKKKKALTFIIIFNNFGFICIFTFVRWYSPSTSFSIILKWSVFATSSMVTFSPDASKVLKGNTRGSKKKSRGNIRFA